MVETRFIIASEMPGSLGETLLSWCIEHGANEFTIELRAAAPSSRARIDALSDDLKAFALEPAARMTVTAGPREPFIRPVALWRACPETVRQLRDYLPHGIFTEPSYAPGGWVEDPILYRDGELMLGVISHEHYGLLGLRKEEYAALAARGLVTHPDDEHLFT